MKAVIGSEADLTRKNSLFEPKLDGIRALCEVNKSLNFFSRNARNITSEYPELDVRNAVKARTAILDGEIVVLDKELSPRFNLWQQGYSAVYIVFDILMLNGKLLIALPLSERKRILEEVVTDGSHIEKCVYTTNGPALWKEIIKRDMEGGMVKDQDSKYYPGVRSSVWRKIKAYKTLEALIIGYTSGKRTISSLLLGIYDGKKIQSIGKVGTGFTEAFLKELLPKLQKLEIDGEHSRTLIENMPTKERKSTWVKPLLICELKYLEFTPSGKLRAPVFLRLRPDKNPQEITFRDQQLTKK